MGVVYILRDVDPLRLRNVLEALGHPPSAEKAIELADAYGAKEEVGELLENRENVPWSAVLAELVTRQAWDLDKSLDRPHGGLIELWKAVPHLAPIRALHDGIVNLDGYGVPKEWSGAFCGLVPEHLVVAAAPAAARFGTEVGMAELSLTRLPGWRRLFTPAAVRAMGRDDYLRGHWVSLCEAVCHVAASGGLLGWDVE